MINLFYKRKDTDKEYNTREIELLEAGRLPIISVPLRFSGVLYPRAGPSQPKRNGMPSTVKNRSYSLQ